MKRLFTLMATLLVVSLGSVHAQTALDFTFTDTQGNQHNLQHALNQGYIVLIDFFFVNCPPCQASSPELVAIANHYQGKNVILWSISDRDGNAAIDGFKQSFDMDFPAGGTAGGGTAVISTYAGAFSFTGFPTISVVCPNGSINWDIWPYTAGAPEWRNAIEACGVVDAAPYQPLMSTNSASIAALSATQLAPNPTGDVSSLALTMRTGAQVSIDLVNAQGALLSTIYSGRLPEGQHFFNADLSALPSGAYWVRIREADGGTQSLQLQKM